MPWRLPAGHSAQRVNRLEDANGSDSWILEPKSKKKRRNEMELETMRTQLREVLADRAKLQADNAVLQTLCTANQALPVVDMALVLPFRCNRQINEFFKADNVM